MKQKRLSMFSANKIVSTVRLEHRNFKSECQWVKSQKLGEIPASLALLTSPMWHAWYSDNVNNNTDDYRLLVNKKLLDCVCITDKQQLDIFIWISQSSYFGAHFQLLLVWVPHGSFETYSWIIYKCKILISICSNIT
jgi:hypothetical protein